MSKPTFVLLHGAWHTPTCWTPLRTHLTSLSYPSIAPHLPSSGSVPPTPDFSADVALIRNTVIELVDAGQDVVVVMHSFSGMTGGTALEGLGKEERREKGLKGGVIRLVYVVAFLVPEGWRHSAVGTKENMVEEMEVDFEAKTITIAPHNAQKMFYQDLPASTTAELAESLQPQSLAAFWDTTTHAAWRHIPTTYILCTRDVPTTVAAARYLVDSAKASGQHRIERVIEVEAGHSPFLSRAEWLARTLVLEAERSG